MENRPFSKLALLEKISHFCADFSQNFESICIHMVEKFDNKGAKKKLILASKWSFERSLMGSIAKVKLYSSLHRD